jgi:hypothetical protein
VRFPGYGGDDDVSESQRRDGFSESARFIALRRIGSGGEDGAEPASARAFVA